MGLLKEEAFEAENFDDAEIIKASSSLTESEVKTLSGSHDNDNGDGDFTPPPLQNETNQSEFDLDDKQIEAACADLNYQVALSANACQEEKFSTDLTVIPKENHSIVIPDDPKDLDIFIKAGEAAIKAAQKILRKPFPCVQEYHMLHQNAKKQGFILLDAALKLSVKLNNIETHEGNRNDLHPDKYRNKPQVLMEDFGMTDKQARRFEALTVDAVDKEKKFANDNNEIPTLTHALKYAETQKKALEKAQEEAQSNACGNDDAEGGIQIPDGKYDIIHMDFNNFDEEFDLSQAANDNALLYIWVDKSKLATAIDWMRKNGFENVDCSVFVRNKTEKGGKYFQDLHKMVLVGKKGDIKPPRFFKSNSVTYENEIGDSSGYAYYESLIKRMYPDLAMLDLTNAKKVPVASEEVQNAENN